LSRSTNSWALVLAPAGAPPVSAEMKSTLRPGDCVVGLLQKGQHALFHLNAALGKRPNLYG